MQVSALIKMLYATAVHKQKTTNKFSLLWMVQCTRPKFRRMCEFMLVNHSYGYMLFSECNRRLIDPAATISKKKLNDEIHRLQNRLKLYDKLNIGIGKRVKWLCSIMRMCFM